MSRTYIAWAAMKARCTNPKNISFPNYGGRGITVCERWLNSFDKFLEDMGEKPKGTSLDRVDNESGYSKENCRWATRLEQARNRRNLHLITFDGRTQTLAQWAEEAGISNSTLGLRLKRGWSLKDALGRKAMDGTLSSLITYQGETLSPIQWARKYGLNLATFRNRLKAGWDMQRALTAPVDTSKHTATWRAAHG